MNDGALPDEQPAVGRDGDGARVDRMPAQPDPQRAAIVGFGRRSQPLPHPLLADLPVPDPVVQPALPALPELDRDGREAVAAPVRGRRDRIVAEAGRHLGHHRVQHLARLDHLRLRRGPGAELRLARPGGEVGLGLLPPDPGHWAGQAHLPLVGQPHERGGRVRVGVQFAALRGVVVGVEDDAALVDFLGQDGPEGRVSLGGDRRQLDRVRLEDGRVGRRGVEPQPQLRVPGARDVGFVEIPAGVVGPQGGRINHRVNLRTCRAGR